MAFILVLSAGCGEKDAVVLDFGQTFPETQATERISALPPLRVAVAAMISPRDTFDQYRQLLDYLGQKLSRDLEFVQRKTYAEINAMLDAGRIDVAFICSGPYVSGKARNRFEALAALEVRQDHFYQAYLIVNQASPIKDFQELKGRSFAFTDPDSNTGKLAPDFWLAEIGERSETFFSRTIFTYSHDNSIMAVARNLVDAASVDGLVWEYYQTTDPSLTAKTRIIRKSEPYGIPPLVASTRLPADTKERMRGILLAMHEDPEGKRVLDQLMIDRFVPLRDEWYDSIRRMQTTLAGQRGSAR